MNKKLVVVEQGKCPLDVLARYTREELEDTVIKFDQSALFRLAKTANYFLRETGFVLIIWDEKDDILATNLMFSETDDGDVYELILAEADDIAFKERAKNPNRVLMFTMEA